MLLEDLDKMIGRHHAMVEQAMDRHLITPLKQRESVHIEQALDSLANG